MENLAKPAPSVEPRLKKLKLPEEVRPIVRNVNGKPTTNFTK